MRGSALAVIGVGAGVLLLAMRTGSVGHSTGLPPGRPSPRTTWAELVRSSTAERLGLENTPPASVLPALRRLAETFVEPLRVALGRRVVVTSGYRSPEVNRAVGGVPNSPHLHGEAVDIVVTGMTPSAVASLVVRLGLRIKELIVYPGPNGHLHAKI